MYQKDLTIDDQGVFVLVVVLDNCYVPTQVTRDGISSLWVELSRNHHRIPFPVLV